MTEPRLSWRVLLTYPLPAMGLSMVFVIVILYLPKFYVDTIGLNVTTMGLLFFISRLVDE